MTINIYELKVSETIPLGTERYQSITPTSGSTVQIYTFFGESAYTANSEVTLIWNYNTQSEQILWSIKGSSKMPLIITIPSSETDGIKKLAIVCDNGELGSLNMSAYAKVEVETQ